MPTFVRAKKDFGYELMLLYSISPYFMYTATREGWDMKSDGEQVYFVNELQKWIPSRLLDVVSELNPN